MFCFSAWLIILDNHNLLLGEPHLVCKLDWDYKSGDSAKIPPHL